MPVAAEEFDVLDRKIKPVAAGIFQRHAIMRRAKRGDRLQPRVAADPVIDMDDQIAGGKRLSFGQEVLGFPAFFRATDQPFAEHVLFGDHRKARRREPVFQRPDGEKKAALAVRHVAHVADRPGPMDLFILQKPLQPFPRALGVGGDDHLPLCLARMNMIGQSAEKVDVLQLTLGREIAPDAPARVQHPRPRCLRKGDKLYHAMPRDRRLPPGVIEIQQPRRGGLVDRIQPILALHRLQSRVVLIRDPLPARQPGGGQLIVQHHRGAGEIVEQCLKPVVEEGQPVFHPGMFAPRADRLIKRVVGAGGAELDAVILPKTGDGGVVEDDLGDGRKFHRRQLFRGALGGRIKAPRAVQNVAEKVKADRPALARWIDVDDAAAHGVVAGFGHRGRL